MKTRLLAGLTLACLAVALAAAGSASAMDHASFGETIGWDHGYSLQAEAVGRIGATDLTLRIQPNGVRADVTHLEAVMIVTRTTRPVVRYGMKILRDVPVSDGVAEIVLQPYPSGTSVAVNVLFYAGTPERPYVAHDSTVVRLRPDLVVASLVPPAQTLTTRAVDVIAVIEEVNGDLNARDASVSLRWGPSLLGTQRISVLAGQSTTVTFSGITLPNPVPVELTVDIAEVDPTEYDTTNNSRTATVDVSEHELVPSSVVVPSLGGYGTQLNQHVFAEITSPPPESLPDLEAKVKALEPQLVRIFFAEQAETTYPDRMDSFIETVQLAHAAGASINITYQSTARAKLNPTLYMGRFAVILEDLVHTRGLTNVRWVTIQNEPNDTAVTLAQYEALYRALHAELVTRGLDDEVGLMGGDLVEFGDASGQPNKNHRDWFTYMAEHMNDIIDAYSVHIYWSYWDIPRMEFRLRDVRQIVTEELPPEARKPVFVTEFGVRGIVNYPGKPSVGASGYWADGTLMARTNIAAFQQLWFNLVSAQLGFAGTVKWDAYWGMYDNTYKAAYWLIGPAEEGWPLMPAYHAMQLLLQTTSRGWQVLTVAPWADDDWKLDELGKPYDQPEKEITAYAGTSGQLTLMGLDSHARGLNTASPDPAGSYSVGGLPPLTAFTLATWNTTGDGTNSVVGTVTTSAAGVARFTVPLHAAFALTTVPVS